jgi:hypothetical protein
MSNNLRDNQVRLREYLREHQHQDLHRSENHSNVRSIRKRFNDRAQVGPIVVFVLAFIMLAVYWIIMSPMVDQLIDVNNAQTSLGIVMSQERSDAINVIRLFFAAFVVFTPIVLAIWLILQSLRNSAGRVY